ncbi:MAG: VOC family protein [Pseudomonadota bacterium]
MAAPLVFFDIAGDDDDVLRDFYEKVFGWTADDRGNYSVPVLAPIQATVRRDPADKYLYIGVDDVAATLDEIVAAGGAVTAARFEVPGVVVLGLFTDPAGNAMGLIEMDGDTPKVPPAA